MLPAPRLPAAELAAFSRMLRIFTETRALAEGKALHLQFMEAGIDGNTFLGNLLVHMYARCGCVEDARSTFERIVNPNVFSWNILLSAYASNGHLQDARSTFDTMAEKSMVAWTTMITLYSNSGYRAEALQFFRAMVLEGVTPDQVTLLTIFDAMANVTTACEGREVHQSVVDAGMRMEVKVENAVINMYGKCKCPVEARLVFDAMSTRNTVTWTAMITGHVENGQSKDALDLYYRMNAEGTKPDDITFLGALQACAGCSALEAGRAVHSHAVEAGLEDNARIRNTLLTMYGKCGCVEEAKLMFESMSVRDLKTWTAMLAAYAQNGHPEEATSTFQQMYHGGVQPCEVTFLSCISACSHGGLLSEGHKFFRAMQEDHCIEPGQDHYICILDLLGRSGKLDEAEELVGNMPFEPDFVSWLTLVGACRLHGDSVRGSRAAEMAFEQRPQNVGAHVLLSKILAAGQDWEGLAKLKLLMKQRNIKNNYGSSCIEVRGKVHEFRVGDTSHLRFKEIIAELKSLMNCLPTDDKRSVMRQHSEKMAICFGLLSTPAGSTLRVVNNIRVCSDCHSAAKVISTLRRRRIVIRDTSRFHHIENGICSCKDYW